ncbi:MULTISPECIES: hypothetical protein [unclassified Deinococcus]|uniref:hypothetical protein n=1 Tax=unclassified Deinococcus TaxID=2623546 RepID=UPI001C2F1A3A|nr:MULTISPECIES: hypothetical protein [unclassified Deinococcus]MDK2011055.1 hypothetical protein [Deinococcus sp. 43]
MTRAPVKLSREMKLLLGLLLLVAAIGLWYVLTNRGAAPDDTAVTPGTTTGTPVTPGDTVPVTPPEQSGSTGQSGQGSGVQSGGQVDVEVIPPFPTGDTASTTTQPEQTDTPPTPAGINPAGTLAAVPGNNPFRPLTIEGDGQTASTPTTAPSSPASTPSASSPVASAPTVTPIPSTGAVGLSPLPSSGNDTGGALPVPTIPVTDGTPSVTPITPGGTVAIGNAPVGTPTGTDIPTGTSTPAPVKPPVAGVSVPGLTRVPASVTAPPTPGAGQGGAAALPTGTPQPGTPQVISEVASGGGVVSATSALDSFVQTQELAFNAVVLGPVNTAIFRSKDGYVVVAVGQTLPDSQVTVKEVTATGATLSLGNDSKTLELDKR